MSICNYKGNIALKRYAMECAAGMLQDVFDVFFQGYEAGNRLYYGARKKTAGFLVTATSTI